MPLFLLIFLLSFADSASAYPEFIGYKYSSCLTCHFNGHGNGPLNDYGRALFGAEIGGRALAFGRTDEQLGEASGFLGRTQMPFWIRPGIKARQLLLRNNPPKSTQEARNITMQAEGNLAIFFHREQKYGFIGSYGYVPVPQRLQLQAQGRKVKEFISREHYFRAQASENVWLYVGMLDKVYGIRHVDHSAYDRAKLGLAQNDQAHSVIAQYIQPSWELSVDVFAGNLYQDADLRQQGVSTMFEYEPIESWRVGASALTSSNKYIKNTRFGAHSRYGFGHGAALLIDAGLIQDAPKTGDAKNGYYVWAEAIQRLVRGYHLFLVGQAYKDKMAGDKADQVRSGFGLLMFPAQRFEWRVELQNGRQFTDNNEVQKDSWTFLTQLHLSL